MEAENKQSDYFGTEKISGILFKAAPPVMLDRLIQALGNIVERFAKRSGIDPECCHILLDTYALRVYTFDKAIRLMLEKRGQYCEIYVFEISRGKGKGCNVQL